MTYRGLSVSESAGVVAVVLSESPAATRGLVGLRMASAKEDGLLFDDFLLPRAFSNCSCVGLPPVAGRCSCAAPTRASIHSPCTFHARAMPTPALSLFGPASLLVCAKSSDVDTQKSVTRTPHGHESSCLKQLPGNDTDGSAVGEPDPFFDLRITPDFLGLALKFSE